MRKMKDSGIAWLGDIPVDWDIKKIKNIARRKSDKNMPDEQVLSLYRELGIVIKDERDDNFNVTSENTDNYKFVEVDDIVVNKMKAWQGSIAVSPYQGIVSPAYYVYRFTNSKIYPRFVHYVLRCKAYLPEYRRLSGGIRIGQWDLSDENFKNIPLPLPKSFIEQKKIADYLDTRCSQIDNIISTQEAIIEKLGDYRLALITEAVTKGLNPNVEMKDSGNQFIGFIPVHWKCSSIRHLHNGLTDGTHGTYQRYDTGRLLLSSKNVREESLEIGSDESYISEEDYNEIVANGFPKKNDLLLCCIGASIGRCILYDRDEPEAFQRSVIMIRSGKYTVPKYLLYCMRSSFALQQEQIFVNQSAQPGLYQGLVGSIIIPFPEIEEQIQIVAYLDEKCSSIGKSIVSKQKIINCLKEYKKSLIYEVVTGKKEV